MATIQKLSGENCLYFQRGRCTRSTVFPPEEGQLCILVAERQKMGRRTLDRLKRLERFGFSIHDRERQVAQRYIVERNLKELAAVSCRNFVDSGLNYPACIHQYQTRCLLRLEICTGRCPNYRLERKKPRDSSSL
jgi:hypothetical protein